MSTPTPRTDAAYAKWQEGWCRTPFGPDFARELERELADIRALADRRNKRDHAADTTHQLVAALDQALDIAQAELAIERAKVKTLSSALQNLVDEQNGAPLETRVGHWQMAMDEAGLALATAAAAPR